MERSNQTEDKAMTTATIASPASVHCFEAAGLGKAPFTFIGIQSDADRAAVNRERECAGEMFTTNNCTSCDFCSQAIHNAFIVRSDDGRTFKVGCNCIRKTGDKGLIRHVTEEESIKRRAKSHDRRMAKMQRERDLIAAFRDGLCVALHSMPHPKGREGTAHDYVTWCVDNHFIGPAVLDLISKAS